MVVAIVGRATKLWLCVRLTIGVYSLATQLNPIFVSSGTALLAVLLTGGLGVSDTVRQAEWGFFRNLALSPAVLCGLLVVPALCGELAIRIVHELVK